MRVINKVFASAAVASLLMAQPVLAVTRLGDSLPAASGSVRGIDRVVSPTRDNQELESENGILIAILAAAAVVAGIFIIEDSGNNVSDLPGSPDRSTRA